MRGIRLSDRILIAGQTGKGKTTLARFLVERLQPLRVICFDPKGELQFAKVTPCRSPDALAVCVRDPLIHYIPESFDRDQLEQACEIVWQTPGPYVWWIDEASEVSSPGYCPPGLRLAVTQGRQARKMVIALTQRLAEIHPVFRSQSEHVIIFTPPPILLDLKTISGHVRREAGGLESELASLHQQEGDFSHVWYVRDTDELRRCAPLQITGITLTKVATPSADHQDVPDSPPCEEWDSG